MSNCGTRREVGRARDEPRHGVCQKSKMRGIMLRPITVRLFRVVVASLMAAGFSGGARGEPALTDSDPAALGAADSPVVVSTRLTPPPATRNYPYAGFTFTASGGSPPYTWKVTSGALPTGLKLAADGLLSGTPTAEGRFTFTVTATDSAKTGRGWHSFEVSVNPPGSVGAGFWLPFKSTPSSSGGQAGLFVIPSTELWAAPAYVSSSENTMLLASGQHITLNERNAATAYSPATTIYAATDTSHRIHLYGLDLASESIPRPIQISSLSLPLASGAAIGTVICDFHASSVNLFEPTTLFVVLHIAGKTGCNTRGDVREVVHYTDSPDTEPRVVDITSTEIQELYAPSGALAGLALLDAADKDFLVYANANFTSPETAIGGGDIESVASVYSGNNLTSTGVAFKGTILFLAVGKTNNAQYLYRLPYTSRTATLEYTGAVGKVVSDGANLYFTDEGEGTPPNLKQLILQEPLAGGTATKLYSYSYNHGVQENPYYLVGSNGSLLVMSTYEESSPGPEQVIVTSYLATLPVGRLSAKTTALGSYAGSLYAFMEETTPGTPSRALVFVSVTFETNEHTQIFSTEVLTPSGTVMPGGDSGAFIYEGTSGLSGYVLQVGTNAYHGNGPWSLNAIELETLASTQLKTPAGGSYKLPEGAHPNLVQESNLIGAGAYGGVGLAYDPSKDLIVPIVIPSTNVAPF
jgi:Putative Ig domain